MIFAGRGWFSCLPLSVVISLLLPVSQSVFVPPELVQ
jgi:hypothetical protein